MINGTKIFITNAGYADIFEILLAVMAALFILSGAYAADGAHWGYTRKNIEDRKSVV